MADADLFVGYGLLFFGCGRVLVLLLVDLLFVWVALGFGFECVVCEWFTGVW